jgi:hypothetical protein
MRIDTKEGLAKIDKAGNVQNQIWHELVQLHAIDKEKPTKKFVGRKRKSTEEKGKEHHPVALLWLRDDLSAGEDNLYACRKKTLLLALHQIHF